MIEFKTKSPDCRVALIERPHPTLADVPQMAAVRVVRDDDGWRCDVAYTTAGAWLPWEAIDDVRYSSATHAEARASTWADGHHFTNIRAV
jgi:hypothetical protein